ncbi:DUF721 domain-containing protein [Croceiramulus getboli]|nr:DUF721 domain-containing protein [Flavobacteriaceae bacterium YJPT1-3]
MSKRQTEPQSMTDALGHFVERNRLRKGMDKVQIEDVWEEIMGPAISKYTEALKLEGSTLLVRLSSSVLREELGYGKEKIIQNINEAMGRELIQKLILR